MATFITFSHLYNSFIIFPFLLHVTKKYNQTYENEILKPVGPQDEVR